MTNVPGASKRRRTTKATTRVAASDEAATRDYPRLRTRDDGERWHPDVSRWWRHVWRSDLIGSVIHAETDEITLRILADVLHRQRTTPATDQRVRLSVEVRQLQSHLGLSPKSRSTARIELERADRADRRRRTRRNVEIVTSTPTNADTSEADTLAASLDQRYGGTA